MPSVITFTGMRRDGIPDDVGAEATASKGYKKIVGYAEKKKVTLCLEMLNTRDDSHPMKGHPGYQGDHTDYCIDIIKRVGSPRLKLLFDIYHVQIMDGDVIRRIRQHKEYIGHVHTAGNPGRGELDDTQEINYPPIMQALVEVGYTGYVGQEFIPDAGRAGRARTGGRACATCELPGALLRLGRSPRHFWLPRWQDTVLFSSPVIAATGCSISRFMDYGCGSFQAHYERLSGYWHQTCPARYGSTNQSHVG